MQPLFDFQCHIRGFELLHHVHLVAVGFHAALYWSFTPQLLLAQSGSSFRLCFAYRPFGLAW